MKFAKKLSKVCVAAVCVAALTVAATIAIAAETGDTAKHPIEYSIHDASRVQRILAEFEPETEEATQKLDVNQNGTVDIQDATLIQRHLAEFIDLNAQ